MLQARLDRAIGLYHTMTPKPQFILSGGQGPDEPISEAEAMRRYLLRQGIPESAIVLETASTSTYENIQYSLRILQQRTRIQNTRTLCVTSQFHILRALRFGQQHAWPLYGVGSRTPLHFLHSAMIRDYLALMYTYRRTLTCYFGILCIITIIIPCIYHLWRYAY